jgi:DNA-binding Lrp family transcriptional regulator
LDDLDKRLLNIIQTDFPLESRPFLKLGESTGLPEEETLVRITALKAARVIRQIGGIFDTQSLGYKSSLVAMRVRADRLDAAATAVSAHPGVSHNYLRDHTFNLWFTLAVPPDSDLAWNVNRLHELAGADSTRTLPTLRLFKIGVRFDMEGKAGGGAEAAGYTEERRPAAGRAGLSPLDIGLIRELQEDLPLVAGPYRPMAERLGISERLFLETAVGLRAKGYMRRMAAVLRHREAGFRANAMGVWAVPAERAAEVGARMAGFPEVSHCYLRPTYPDWPYSIFTMVHGQTAADCQAAIDAISAATGITEYALLYSLKEYKKVRLRYFSPELEEWEDRARAAQDATVGAAADGPR